MVLKQGEYTCGSFPWDVHSGGRQMFSDIYRYGGRFKDRPSVPISYNPEVTSTLCGRHVLLEQTCSVISYSFIFFFNSFYAGTCRTFLLGPLLISQAHFLWFCKTFLFVTFRTSSDVAGPDIILLYSGTASKSIRYKTRGAWSIASC